MKKPKYNLIILFLLLFVGLTIPIINFFTKDNLETCGYSSNTVIKNIDLTQCKGNNQYEKLLYFAMKTENNTYIFFINLDVKFFLNIKYF